jgi:hypothetical protein
MTWREYLDQTPETKSQWRLHEARSGRVWIDEAYEDGPSYELVTEPELDRAIPQGWDHKKDTVIFNGDVWTR